MLRAVLLTLGLMLSLGVAIPLLTNSTEASRPRHHHRHKKFKKYSRAWWRAYHRRERRHKALVARKRALRLRQEMLARQSGNGDSTIVDAADKSRRQSAVKENNTLAVLPSGENAPSGWRRDQTSANELKFRVDDDGGNQLGSASISVVGPATGTDSDGFRNKSVGGVSTNALRRTVIDRMMKEDGWVVNDYQKDLNGKKVYVVVAQSKGANNQTQSRLFYFTEVEGKIYSVASAAPNESSERLAQESEKVINSLQRSNRSMQSAELR
ncbi:MAG: hypothetical protein ACR2N3_17670 [Pyrinomonadaceae bacterium]